MKKRLLPLLLVLCLALSACSGGAIGQNGGDAASPEGSSESYPESSEQASTSVTSSESSAETAVETTMEPNGDIVILYTSDVHCGIDQGFGYAGVSQIRSYLESQGDTVLLVDDGDSIQGEPIGTMTKGSSIIELMNALQYDAAIPGNHEFDYGMETFLSLAEQAEFPYISCNFNKEGELIFPPYIIKEAAGKKIAFVGVTTPKTLSSSEPTSFQDENGNYIYGFFKDKTGEGVYNAVQKAVDDARKEGADYVYVMGHIGLEESCRPWTYEDIITHTNGIDVFLDGHSHDTEQVVVKNKDGVPVPRSACGTKLNAVGYSRISAEDGGIETNLYTWNNKTAAPQLLGVDNETGAKVKEENDALAEKLNEVVGSTDVTLTINDPTAVDDNGSPLRIVRSQETNVGDLCADAYRDQTGADIAFTNGGGIRASIEKGDITLGNLLSVQPYGNAICVVEVTGQQILDSLEWGAHGLPGESGGFLQVSGLSYEIHTYLPSTCTEDENGQFTGVTGEYRVKNVQVGGKPLDLKKTYTLAGHDYLLLHKGDGFTTFAGCPLLQDRVKLDNQVLIDYITETLGGTVGKEYDDPYGQGRITIVEQAP